METKEIAWLAGLFEGEGCIQTQRLDTKKRQGNSIKMNIGSTDRDVIEHAAQLLGVRVLGPYKNHGGKLMYRAIVCGDRAAGWLMTIYSLLGKRRRERVSEALAFWKSYWPRTKGERASLLTA